MFKETLAKKLPPAEQNPAANDTEAFDNQNHIPANLIWEPQQPSDSKFNSIYPIEDQENDAFVERGIIFEKPIIADEAFQPKRLTPADFLAKNIIARKEAAGYVISDTSKPSDNTEAIPTETLPRLTRADFNPTELEKKYTDNIRLQNGLKDPEDSQVLAETRELLLNTITDNAVAGYRPIEKLRPTPKKPAALGYTATVQIPQTRNDSYQPKVPQPLDMYHFPRGQRLPPITLKGNESVTPQPGIFKRLKTEFLERFWYR